MAATTDYCGRNDVRDRLTQAGVIYVADDNQDGIVKSAEWANAIDPAIEYAGSLIDAALWRHVDTVPIPQDDGSRNPFLKHIAIALAAEHACERGGANVPLSLADAAARARTDLEAIDVGGKRPPGIEYPVDDRVDELRDLGRPVVASPARARMRRMGRNRRGGCC